jgi:hypothetical protein
MDDIDADPCLARPGPSGLKSLGNTTMFKRVSEKNLEPPNNIKKSSLVGSRMPFSLELSIPTLLSK